MAVNRLFLLPDACPTGWRQRLYPLLGEFLWARLLVSLRLLFCLSALIWLGSCAAPAQTPRADVVVAVPQGVEAQALQAVAAAYQQETGRRVEVVELNSSAYADQVEAVLLAGLDRYDLLLIPSDFLPKWASYQVLLPMQAVVDGVPLAENPDLAPWLPALTFDGMIYGLPTQPEVEVIWYRADLLAQAGLAVPRTWTDFEQAALALNEPPERYGAAISGGPLDAGSEFAAVMAGFGSAAISSNYQVQINSAEAVQALAWYAGLRNEARVVPPESDRSSRADVVRLLAEGRVALGVAPLSAARELRDCVDRPELCSGDQTLLEWTWLPGAATIDGRPGTGPTAVFGRVSAWAIPRHAANSKAAEDFAAWLGGAAGARIWASGGGTPAHRSVLVGLDRPEKALGQEVTFHMAFPPVITSDQLWSAYHAAAHAAVAGEKTPEQALREAETEMNNALRQTGY